MSTHSQSTDTSQRHVGPDEVIVRTAGATAASPGPAGIAYDVIEPTSSNGTGDVVVTQTRALPTGCVSTRQAVYLSIQHALQACLQIGVQRVHVRITDADIAAQFRESGSDDTVPAGEEPYRQTVRDLLARFDEARVGTTHASPGNELMERAAEVVEG